MDEFKEAKRHTFDADLRNPEDEKPWLLGMNKFFELRDYIENMKARIDILSLKGEADIKLEDVNEVRDIRTNELSWH